jgi:hypothetical protein
VEVWLGSIGFSLMALLPEWMAPLSAEPADRSSKQA